MPRYDPFAAPDVLRLAPGAESPAARPPTRPWNPRLRAVLVAGAASLANVDGEVLALGQEVDGYRLVEVRERSAVFHHGDEERVLSLDN